VLSIFEQLRIVGCRVQALGVCNHLYFQLTSGVDFILNLRGKEVESRISISLGLDCGTLEEGI
jgi:hypothetical protein